MIDFLNFEINGISHKKSFRGICRLIFAQCAPLSWRKIKPGKLIYISNKPQPQASLREMSLLDARSLKYVCYGVDVILCSYEYFSTRKLLRDPRNFLLRHILFKEP